MQKTKQKNKTKTIVSSCICFNLSLQYTYFANVQKLNADLKVVWNNDIMLDDIYGYTGKVK